MSPLLPLYKIPVSNLKEIQPNHQQRLTRLGIITFQDLLFHFPIRYENRTHITPIGTLKLGDSVLIEGEIQHGEIFSGRRRYLSLRIADSTGSILLKFFHFTPSQSEDFQPGVKLRCYGQVRQGPTALELVHPTYKKIPLLHENNLSNTLTPIYPSTTGIKQSHWQMWIKQVLRMLTNNPAYMPELLPTEISLGDPLWSLASAIRFLHNPPVNANIEEINQQRHPAQLRLAIEELLAHQIGMRRLRLNNHLIAAPKLATSKFLCHHFIQQLPFQLTTAQQRVITEITQDLNRHHPMLRLLQGDVGSGKTVVAVIAALQTIEAGYQVALMAPTEILAEQHQRCIRDWLTPLGIEVVWVKRQLKLERKKTLDMLARNSPLFIIGTHALIQEDVTFTNLGLVIIDEQHKFGVHQRIALRDKGVQNGFVPHQLIMTATPIPRSLAITAYADLDISTLDEQPPGRGKVITAIVPNSRRDEVIARIRLACTAGRQVYWICTLIEESGVLQYQAAKNTAILLRQALVGINIDLVHGRMKSAEREAIMLNFKQGIVKLLVATTVIEVGLDVPNASLIIIENPERLGLAQLHQLRGRVGRGDMESHCLLMYHPPLTPAAAERLRIIRSTNDGFAIARCDLELRGPGELLGIRQSGEMQFKIANLMQHQDLLPVVQSTADYMLINKPDTAKMLEERWQVHKDQLPNMMQ